MGAFTNPGDYRELMKAVVGFSDKTVEQVRADIEARDAQAEQERKAKSASRGGKRAAAAPAVGAPITASHMDSLAALRAAADAAKAEAENG